MSIMDTISDGQSDSLEGSEPSFPLLPGDTDPFNGVTVKENHYDSLTVEQFRERLTASLSAWRAEGRRGVWLRIPLARSELVPVAAKLGYQFHHAKAKYVMMNQWLPLVEQNVLPIFASHNIGVAGFVVNDKDQVLLIQEKWLAKISVTHWKLPGGVADPGEDLWQTAIRETKEEVGIATEFVSMLCFRHMHGYRWGTDDIYFACLLRPLDMEIKIDPNEIADAKWMDVGAYIADPETAPTNRMITQSYLDGKERGLFLQPTVYPNFIKGKPDLIMYTLKPSDFKAKSCDQNEIESQTSPKSNI